MPFSATDSLTSTIMNNLLRGLYRDNADHAVTGTLSETNMASTTITANTVGATGALLIVGGGTTTGAAATRTITLKLGSTSLALITPSTALDWGFIAILVNTVTNAQRWLVFCMSGSGSIVKTTTSAIDTTADQTLAVSTTLGNTGDTTTQKTFNVFIAQIT